MLSDLFISRWPSTQTTATNGSSKVLLDNLDRIDGFFDTSRTPLWKLLIVIIVLSYTLNAYVTYRKSWTNIPISGSHYRLFGIFQYALHAKSILRLGYSTHRTSGSAFKVAEFGKGWHVFLTHPKMVEELRKANDEVLNANAVFTEQVQTNTTMGRHIVQDLYHIPVIQSVLTRHITSKFPSILDEITSILPPSSSPDTNTTTTHHAYSLMRTLITRITSRTFVGLPVARDSEYMDCIYKFTIDLFVGAQLVSVWPEWMKPYILKYFTRVPARMATAHRLLDPIIEQRYRDIEEFGRDWEGIPEDLITWFIDASNGTEKASEMVPRIMAINLAAIHTTTLNITFALLNLVKHSSLYVQALRQEISASLTKSNGVWSKEMIGRCRKLDSFIKESMRFTSSQAALIIRRTLSPYTFSPPATPSSNPQPPPLHLPTGTYISVPADAIHFDTSIWGPTAGEFDGFRHVTGGEGIVDEEAGTGTGKGGGMTSTSCHFLVFSSGRHACPGRFFAANEMKAVLGWIVMNYDVAFEDEEKWMDESKWPVWFGADRVPDSGIEVVFRARKAEGGN